MRINTDRLLAEIANQQLTFSALSSAAGLSRVCIGNTIRRGTCTPATAGKIAAALGMDVLLLTTKSREGVKEE